jgi:hypothetical protein
VEIAHNSLIACDRADIAPRALGSQIRWDAQREGVIDDPDGQGYVIGNTGHF